MTLVLWNGLRVLVWICLILAPWNMSAVRAGNLQVVHIVRNDLGGRIDRRAAWVQTLRDRGARVEIRGRVCLSACTLFLGAKRVCIDADTVFGFHAPSLWGQPLDGPSFDYWSDMIASHYNPPLRQWYLEVARHRVHGYHRLSGRQLIELGYEPCREI